MSLDASVGGAASNSYITLSDANAYLLDRMYVDNWTNADDATKSAALITATRRLDQEDYEGSRVTFTQALKWPRAWAPLEDGGYGFAYYPVDSIPQPVKDATCEYALYLLTGDVLSESDLINFKRVKVGSLELEMNQPQRSGKIPAQALRMLRHLIKSGASVIRT